MNWSIRKANPLTWLFSLGFLIYAYFFCRGLSRYWFNPQWTTDDAMQQIYPFYKVYHPHLFEGDLITKMMECYLAPLHYWLSYFITLVTGDPILMGHWVMLIQITAALVMVFLAVRRISSTPAGIFAALWFLHSRHIVQRTTGGVPRGWAPFVISCFLYLLVSKRYNALIAFLPVACILHPPSALLLCVTYGIFLLWNISFTSTRAEIKPHFVRAIFMVPIIFAAALWVSRMPSEIGTMASYERASQMPEFQKPDGRFPFVPLRGISDQVRSFGFQVFTGRFYNPGRFLKRYIPEIVCVLLVGIIVAAALRGRSAIPKELWCYGLAAVLVYALSRQLAFKLYLPDRHLQIPFGMFFILTLSAGCWRVFSGELSSATGSDSRIRQQLLSTIALVLLGGFIYLGSGNGLQGAMNFNTHPYKRGKVFEWISSHTQESALISGHPTFIDPVMLYGKRRGFVTTETAHPFFDVYYTEMKRRTEVAFRMHYAVSLEEFLKFAAQEGITHVVFEKAAFAPQRLSQERYFAPFNPLIKELTQKPIEEFLYSRLIKLPPGEENPIVFQDALSILVDISKIKKDI